LVLKNLPSWSTRSPFPEPADQAARLLERGQLKIARRPVESERRFVQRFARAQTDEDAARIHRLERREPLRHERRVVALQGDGDSRADRHMLGSLSGRAEPDPGLAGMAGFPPGLKMV